MKKTIYGFVVVAFFLSCNNINNTGNADQKANDSVKDSLLKKTVTVTQILNFRRFQKMEKFTFVNSKGFVYKGKGGTVLKFPPGVFNCAAKDSVQISVCEYSDLTSMLEANLCTTTSDNKTLETNGMVYCKAYCNNKELEIKKGKSFSCMFNKTKKSDYKLFEGTEKDGTIYWKNPVNAISKKTSTNIIMVPKVDEGKKEALRICSYGTGNDIPEIESALSFPGDSTSHIISYFLNKYDIPYSDLIPLSPEESIVLYFTLTKEGKLVFTNTDNLINARISNKLIAYFEKMPRLKGFINKSTGQKEDLPIFINITPNKLLAERLQSDKDNINRLKQIAADNEAREKEIQKEKEKLEKERIEKDKLAFEKAEKMQNMIDESNKVIFESNKLGWMNCDRFYTDPRPKIELFFAELEKYTSFNIKIIFTSIKSFKQISYGNTAEALPINEPINIVFVGIKEGSLFFFNKKMVTSKKDNEIEILATRTDIKDLKKQIENSLN
jgi:hypothetical protein